MEAAPANDVLIPQGSQPGHQQEKRWSEGQRAEGTCHAVRSARPELTSEDLLRLRFSKLSWDDGEKMPETDMHCDTLRKSTDLPSTVSCWLQGLTAAL